MPRPTVQSHPERHRTDRVGWLRAAVLGANDGAISVASVVVGVAASGVGASAFLAAGTAALVAGAVSMAAGEYVSVQSQADTERANLLRERDELASDTEGERAELAAIYQTRGLDAALAQRVAEALMAHDALGAHARDELGITETLQARPVQAALASAASFVVGAILPLVAAVASPAAHVGAVVAAVTLLTLAVLGALAGYAGGASTWRGAVRVAFWGALAMALTAGMGSLFG
ncbi:MAG: VIT1/CCC1 transporter family protein [Rhodothermales bacterium]